MPSLYASINDVNTKIKSVYGLMNGVNTKMKSGYALVGGVNSKVFSAGIPIGNLAVGARVKFGTIYGKPIIWYVAELNHAGYPANSITLVSQYIIKMLAFDAPEPANPSPTIQINGSARYLVSNIRQWLNTTSVSPWYVAQQVADGAPNVAHLGIDGNAYAEQNGFLNPFSQAHMNLLLTTSVGCD